MALDVDDFQAKAAAGIAAHRRGETAAAAASLGEALALYRLNALDASVKGALEHGLP